MGRIKPQFVSAFQFYHKHFRHYRSARVVSSEREASVFCADEPQSILNVFLCRTFPNSRPFSFRLFLYDIELRSDRNKTRISTIHFPVKNIHY